MATPTKLTAETITAARTFRSGLVFARLTMFQTAFIATSTITAMAASKTAPLLGDTSVLRTDLATRARYPRKPGKSLFHGGGS